LKADLHLHTREGEQFIAYDARSLIDRAASAGYQVLAITNHDTLTGGEALRAYAWERGVLLIPGAEMTIEGRHVLVYDPRVPLGRIATFADLRRLRRLVGLVVAPHPFFPGRTSLRQHLLRNLDLFDAVEYCHFRTRGIDFNPSAVRLAREAGLPLLGTSDSHLARQFGTTYSLIDAEPSVDSVLTAIRDGRVEVISRPLTVSGWVGIGAELSISVSLERAKTLARALLGASSKSDRPPHGAGAMRWPAPSLACGPRRVRRPRLRKAGDMDCKFF
jgi:predicted metal-dependent phosphoesterase TrpH